MIAPQLGRAGLMPRSRAGLRPVTLCVSAAPLPLQSSSHTVPHRGYHSKRYGKPWNKARKAEQDDTEDQFDGKVKQIRERWRGLQERNAYIKQALQNDPYEAVFGKRFQPFWKTLMPEDGTSGQAVNQADSETGSHTATESSGSARPKYYAQSRSFSVHTRQDAGERAKVEATSTSWDSNSNEVKTLVYDPISGRMVPPATADATSSLQQSPQNKLQDAEQAPNPCYEKPAILSKLPEDDLDFLTPEDVRASMGKARQTPSQTPADRAAQFSALEDDYNSKVFKSEHEELVETRRALAALRAQNQILERKAHGSTLTKPDDDLDRPPVFEDGWNEAPQGLQLGFENEKEACEHGEKKSLEQEMCALNSRHVQEITDDYPADPKGMETSYRQEGEHTLEDELIAMSKEPKHMSWDGYAITPQGLETSFSKEQEETGDARLEEEMRVLGRSEITVEYDDGYSKQPTGLQTAYKQEDGKGESLEEELQRQAKEVHHVNPEDGYSKDPTGMETSFKHEEASGKSLEQDMKELCAEKQYDDGYSIEPKGMQTSFQNEESSGNSLEKEMQEKMKQDKYDDGYSTDLKGMQTSFQQEELSGKTLEQEMQEVPQREVYDDGYSTEPKGMQTSFQKEESSGNSLEQEMQKTLEQEKYDDGYSTEPKGMQTSFEQEQQNGDSLEQDMQRRLQHEPESDGYSTTPSGLETAFNKEEHESALGKRRSLEDEIKAGPEQATADPGYSTLPIGLQVLFHNQIREARMGRRQTPEDVKSVRDHAATRTSNAEPYTQSTAMEGAEAGHSGEPNGMRASFATGQQQEQSDIMPGEGDINPNVSKFIHSHRWYKRPASGRLSEDMKKTEQTALERALGKEARLTFDNVSATAGSSSANVKDAEALQACNGTASSKKASAQQKHTGSVLTQDLPADELSNFKWAEPALYKVIAYDTHKDAITITTTPSNFSNSDSPLSIATALSRLHQPARFIPHFASLQHEGYHVLHASRDWLVMRKVDKPNGSVGHGVVNPVDPVARRMFEEPPIGRFASPTGFVNHDPIFPPDPTPARAPADAAREVLPEVEEYRNFSSRRGRREEPAFSDKRWKHRRDGGIRKERRSHFRDRVMWALSVGAGTAVCVYAVGVGTELARMDRTTGTSGK